MNAETPISQSIRLEAGRLGAALFRNAVGKLQNRQGAWVSFGIGGAGGSDLVGWTIDGRFLAIEVKVPGARTEPERLAAQQKFIDAVKRDGGRAGFASSVEEARAIILG